MGIPAVWLLASMPFLFAKNPPPQGVYLVFSATAAAAAHTGVATSSTSSVGAGAVFAAAESVPDLLLLLALVTVAAGCSGSWHGGRVGERWRCGCRALLCCVLGIDFPAADRSTMRRLAIDLPICTTTSSALCAPCPS